MNGSYGAAEDLGYGRIAALQRDAAVVEVGGDLIGEVDVAALAVEGKGPFDAATRKPVEDAKETLQVEVGGVALPVAGIGRIEIDEIASAGLGDCGFVVLT